MGIIENTDIIIKHTLDPLSAAVYMFQQKKVTKLRSKNLVSNRQNMLFMAEEYVVNIELILTIKHQLKSRKKKKNQMMNRMMKKIKMTKKMKTIPKKYYK